MKKLIITCLLCLSIDLCFGQSNPIKSDSLYYDSWVGEWYRETDGKLNNKPDFVVKRGLYHSSFEEYWLGSGGSDFSVAWRAWDKRTQKWDFAWMSTEGLFQIWEGKKIDGVWYIYNKFIINGAEVLSRQAFILQNETTMIRTSEHSSDNGNTWKLRFKEIYKKK